MANGYWVRFYVQGCVCCRSGPKSKFLCEACLHVCKAPWNGKPPYCPAGHGPMRNMGDKWRPAKKGKRSVPPLLPYQQGFPSAGESLLEKLEKGVASTRKGRVG